MLVKKEVAGVGGAAFLACLLTSALFLSPLLATQFDFGHRHSEDTPAHVHSIDGVLGATVVSEATTAVSFVTLLFFLILSFGSTLLKLHSDPANGIRAPPRN